MQNYFRYRYWSFSELKVCKENNPSFLNHTAKTQYRKFETNISRKETARLQSPISTFMFLWAVCIFLWSVCLLCCRKIGGPNVGIYRSLTDTEIGTVAAQFLFWEYKNSNFFALQQIFSFFVYQWSYSSYLFCPSSVLRKAKASSIFLMV